MQRIEPTYRSKTLFRILLIFMMMMSTASLCQAQDRFDDLGKQLEELSASTAPGLNQPVTASVSRVSIQEFVRGMAIANNLNINVDPTLDISIIVNFADEPVRNILLFLCKEHDLNIEFIGSILSVNKYNAPPTPVEKPAPKEPSIVYDAQNALLTFDLKNDTLNSVVKSIIQKTGKNVVLSPGTGDRLVNGFLQNAPVEKALEKLAFANGLKATKTEDDFFMIEEVVAETKQTSRNRNQGKGGQQGVTAMPENLEIAIGTDFNDQPLISINAVNVPIAELVKQTAKELEINYFLFSEPQGSTTAQITGLTFDEFLSYVLQGTDHTFKEDEGIYLIGNRSQEGLRATRVIQLQYRSLEIVLENVPSEMKKGVEINAFEELNSLILSGSLPRILEIENFIREIDKLVPVIMIEVMIVDVNRGKAISTGLEAGLTTDEVQTGGTFLPGLDLTLSSGSINEILTLISGGGVLNLGQVTPQFYAKLNMLETQNVLRIRSSPKLSTLNGHEATMSIGATDYYLEQQSQLQGTQNPISTVTNRYVPVDANFSITIDPTVSGDDQVTLNVNVDQSSFTSKIAPDAPPGKTNRNFQSMVRVKNEEMIVLGGLEEKKFSDSGKGTPLLSRIPVIKWFFSNRTKETSKSELLIFIKPTILN